METGIYEIPGSLAVLLHHGNLENEDLSHNADLLDSTQLIVKANFSIQPGAESSHKNTLLNCGMFLPTLTKTFLFTIRQFKWVMIAFLSIKKYFLTSANTEPGHRKVLASSASTVTSTLVG